MYRSKIQAARQGGSAEVEHLEVSQQEADTKPEHTRCKSEAQRAAVGTVTVQIRDHQEPGDSVGWRDGTTHIH